MNYTNFDKTEFYEQEIKEKLIEIKRICNRNQIPFYFSACIKNTEEDGSVYINEMINAKTNNIVLRDDKFPDYLNVFNGFKTTYFQDDFAIDTEHLNFLDDLESGEKL